MNLHYIISMKKIIGTCILGISLILSLLMLINITKADIWTLTLTINSGTNSCEFGTSLNLWSQAWSLSFPLIFSGYFTGTSSTFSCTSNDGQNVSISIQISSDLTNATSQTISSGSVFLQTTANQVTAGACFTGAGTVSRTPISGAQTILSKINNPGQVCTVSASGIQLKVVTATAQAVGLYTGTLVFSVYY